MRKLESRPWWPALVERKDAFSLRELAEIFGASTGAIQSALQRQGLSRESSPTGPRTRKKALSVAKNMQKPRGRNARAMTEKRLAPYADQLGLVADGEIAQSVGLSTATVARIRRSRGIASFTSMGDSRWALGTAQDSGPQGWQLLPMDDSRPVVVFADSIFKAVKEAQKYGMEVREIRRTAPLFRV